LVRCHVSDALQQPVSGVATALRAALGVECTVMESDALREIRDAIRTIPDYPKPGVMFRDITTLLGNARVFRSVVDLLVGPWLGARIDRVAGIEARGFILGGAIAHQLSAGFVPIR